MGKAFEEEADIDKRWEEMKEIIHNSMIKKMWKKKVEIMQRKWWDKECKSKKRELKKELKKWRKGMTGKEKYLKERKKFKEMCREKERKKQEKELAEIKEAKTEKKIWEFINKYRKARPGVNKNIGIEVWKEHFCQLLKGTTEET
ncbi:hypothetical protein PV328_012122, partial [Microctonus aethiopoides]